MNNHHDFLHALRSIKLPSAHKERMRADLSAYADLHSVPDTFFTPVRSPFSSFVLRTRSLYAGALALVLIVAGGTQASFAAENAKPGDVLYPIKVAIAEPITLALATSPEQKAELAARYASRRVDEAARLASEGKLDAEAADELALNFDTHVDVLAKEAETLEARGNLSVSLAVRTDLEQRLSDRVEEFVVADVASEDLALAAVPVSEEAPEDRFTARVFEKSKALATTRERLESALALDIEADAGTVDLAAIRVTASSEAESSVLFHATASSTATTTATSTEPVSESPASLFFAPFLKR